MFSWSVVGWKCGWAEERLFGGSGGCKHRCSAFKSADECLWDVASDPNILFSLERHSELRLCPHIDNASVDKVNTTNG